MRIFRRWELRSIDLGSGMTTHVSWHARIATAERAKTYWQDRYWSNDGERSDLGMGFYVREVSE